MHPDKTVCKGPEERAVESVVLVDRVAVVDPTVDAVATAILRRALVAVELGLEGMAGLATVGSMSTVATVVVQVMQHKVVRALTQAALVTQEAVALPMAVHR